MIILDTNVVSEQSKPVANDRAVAWLNRQHPETLFLTAITMAELLKGVVVLPDGKRKETVRRAVDAAIASFVGRVLPFDEAAAIAHSEIVPSGEEQSIYIARCRWLDRSDCSGTWICCGDAGRDTISSCGCASHQSLGRITL